MKRAEGPPGEPFQITESQQGLLIVDRLVPAQQTYHIVMRFEVDPGLPVATIRRALAELVSVQPALRQVFARLPETAARLAPPPAPEHIPLELVDVPPEEYAGAEAALAERLYRRCFDLHAGPLYRFALLRATDGSVAAILSCWHHIASDVMSIDPIIRDLGTALTDTPDPARTAARRAKRESALRREVAAQLRSAATESAAARVRALAEQVRDVPPLVLAPRPDRPTETDFTAGRLSWRLDATESAQFRDTCRRLEITPFVLLTAVYGAVLARHGGVPSVLIGSPLVARRTVGAFDLAGFFLNTLPIPVEVEWTRTVDEHAAVVREAVDHCRANADLSLGRLVAEVGHDRVGSRNPLFGAMLAMQDTFETPPSGPVRGVRELSTGTVKFDIRLRPALVGECWLLELEHDRTLISSGVARGLLDSLRTALRRAVSGVVPTLAGLFDDAAPPAGPRALPAPAATLAGWFDHTARGLPDAVAVAEPGRRLTYGQLTDAAGRVAAGLVYHGVGTGDVVGLATGGALRDTVVAMLAILRCGATFLPLDATLPAARLATITRLAGCRIAAGCGVAVPGLRVIGLDELAAAGTGGTVPGGNSASAAYLMFTSGSTGIPKGVLMGHGPLLNRAAWQMSAFGLGPDTRFLQYAPLGFDVSFNEIVPTLAAGGTLVSREPADRRDFPALVQRVAETAVTHVYLPAAALRPFARAARSAAARFPALRLVCVSGEQLIVDDEIRAFFAGHPDCTLINSYGPTETNGATWHRLPGDPATWPTHVPIGRPLPGVLAYVVDRTGHLAPPGVPGELVLGGCCPADGYVGDPDRTAASFLPDRFAGTGRMYRTGDQVVRDEHGTLTYLGRQDNRVKIRGYRVELGEIETIAHQDPEVRQAVAVARGAGADRELVLFTVPDKETGVDHAALRDRLRGSLPGYMVPARFFDVDRIPTSATGKVDRIALASLADRRVAEGGPGEGGRDPRTPVEQVLCRLFGEVLGRTGVGVEDGFFELGGHSLVATRLISRIRTVLGVELPIRMVFDVPTVAGLARHLDRTGRTRPALARVARPDHLPVSFAQQRLWFLDQLDGPSPTYHLPVAVRITGRLDPHALRAALTDVVARHEALRTTITEIDGKPYQNIVPAADVAVAWHVNAIAEHELRAELARAARHPFDLSAELPVRAWLFRLAEHESVLLLLLHHIACDGWSVTPLRRDLFTAYQARANRRRPDWADLPVQYADYTLWQQTLLGTDDDPRSLISEQLEYWRQALAAMPSELALPTHRQRPAVASHQGDRVPLTVSPELHRDLLRLAHDTGTTVFMVVQAGLAALLPRLGVGTDIPLATAVAGRTDEALDDLVGFFVNTLVLRTNVAGDPSFRELLDRVRETDLAAFAHQDVPFERLVEALNPPRSMGRHPLVQIMLSINSSPPGWPEPAGLSVTAEPLDEPVAKFDLSMFLTESHTDDGEPAGIHGLIDYATDLFDRATVDAVARGFERLLRWVTTNPDAPVGRAELLDDAQRRRLVVACNDTATTVPAATLPELISAQTRRTPDAVAVRAGVESLSYAELDTRSDRLARALVGRGVGPERLVAVALPPSVDLLVALVGVLKAGGAYLPIDPTLPAERIDFMLADAEPVLLLTVAELAATPDDPGAHPLPAPKPHHPAYVIYTSGSTGRPKGVVVEHRSLTNYLAVAAECPGVRGTALVHTSVAFDLTVTGLLAPLTVGGTVHLAALDDTDGGTLAALRDWPYTALKATPSHLPLLTILPAEFSPGAGLILGGEQLFGESLTGWRSAHPEATVMNHYGPTETTVACAMYRIEPGAPVPPGPVPIGKPVANTAVYVLDDRLRPVDVGLPGELYIAGAGLARGYLNQPGLTASRFVANPFQPGTRMYRTGDLVRRDSHGNLVFLRRVDDQVKLRGFRIEPGEVESVLRDHPSVKQAAVAIRDDRLAGYVVTDDAVTPAALRAFARQRLPEHMVPATVTHIQTLPLTANGKLNRAALPAPQLPAATTNGAPRTPHQTVLCGLFAEVLGRTTVGIGDNFFELGGHSLLAIKLASRVRTILGVELPIRTVFECPTVTDLTQRLDRTGRTRPALARVARPDHLPVSFAQQRLWFLDQLDGPSPTYHLPVAVRITGRLDPHALRAALTDVVARHEALRTTITEFDGQPYQNILPATEIVVTVETRATTEDELRAELARAVRRPFDLSAEPPVRAWLFRLAEHESVLLLLLHHIACDGWSMTPLRRDLFTAYQARANRRRPDWPDLPVQYADYTLWQRTLLGAEDDPGSLLSKQLGYWRQELTGIPQELPLPTHRARPAVASHQGDRVPFTLDPQLHQDLLRLAHDSGTTLFMVLQAGLAAVLSRLGAGTDIPLATPIAGRTDEALDDLIGFFVNTLVLRTNVAGDPSFRELLDRVRETDLAAFAHQDVPFERLVEALNPPRSMGRHPLTQIMLSVTGDTQESHQPPGLSITTEPLDTTAAKFDLSLHLIEWHTNTNKTTGIHGLLTYATDLFDHTTATAITRGLEHLLRWATTNPDTPIQQAELLDDAQRHRLVMECNDTAATMPAATLPELITAQARRTPETTAVRQGTNSLTYTELDARSDQLARALIHRGVGPDRIVAVTLPPSVDLLVALIGVLKAGGAYLPIDPSLPADRIDFMLTDAKPLLLLTSDELATLPDDDSTPPLPAPTPHHTAYVIYTSGSTGRPKGVVVEHGSLANYLTVAAAEYPGVRGTVIVHSTVAFDLTITGLLAPLTVGGTVHLAALDDTDADTVAALRDRPCTAMKATPSHMPLLTALPAEYSPRTDLVIGGEALLGESLAGWRAAHPEAAVVNEYGPTEATVGCSVYRLEPGQPTPVGAVPIGKPIANTAVYVLDDRLRPVDVGLPGELYVAGAGLARGYLNRPGLTASRFVANPFELGTRMYRTGDLVRRDGDGNLVFLGRTDDQIKLRGFRIEPGEVESVLRDHPSVEQAAVVIRDDRLAGYVVADEAATPAALRAFARSRLPEHMVPATVTRIQALPLTANGKLDRAALPAPLPPAATTGGTPRTPHQSVLCGLFGEVLGRTTVGVGDNFFELGGHSLLAIRLISRIRTVLGVELPIRTVFECPTVADLADRLELGSQRDAFDAVLPLRAAGGHPPLFCLPALSGMSWPYAGLLRHLGSEFPIYGLQALGEPRPESLDELVDHYVARITAIQPEGTYFLLGWSFGGIVAHLVATRLERRGDTVGLLVLLDSHPERSAAEEPAAPDPTRLFDVDTLAALPAAEVRTLTDNAMHYRRLSAHAKLDTVSADVLLFAAANDTDNRLTEEKWRPYVTGQIDLVQTGIRHYDMLRPESLTCLGPILAEWLAKVTQG